MSVGATFEPHDRPERAAFLGVGSIADRCALVGREKAGLSTGG
jgi:hypothetical protein